VRPAFFLLLFANLAYLAWANWIDVPQPAPANAAFAKLPRLKLVTEVSPDAAPPASASARRTALQMPAAATSRCTSVGPFNDLASATRGAAQLREKGFTPTQRSEQGDVPKGFWVYIGSLTSDVEVTRVLRVLEQASIQDAHLMPESGEARRVSVGLFSDRQRADRRAQAVLKLGLQPEVAERKLPGTVFWEDVTLPAGSASLSTQDLSGEGPGGSHIEAVPCPGGPGQETTPTRSPTFPTKVAVGASKVP
jgi:hypothetical protein